MSGNEIHAGVPWVSFMLITGHFYRSEASLLSLNYFVNYMNIHKEKKTIQVPEIS